MTRKSKAKKAAEAASAAAGESPQQAAATQPSEGAQAEAGPSTALTQQQLSQPLQQLQLSAPQQRLAAPMPFQQRFRAPLAPQQIEQQQPPPPQVWQRVPGPAQAQQRPVGPQQVQQRSQAPQQGQEPPAPTAQAWQRPAAPQQAQQVRPAAPQQAQQVRPATAQPWQRPPAPAQAQQQAEQPPPEQTVQPRTSQVQQASKQPQEGKKHADQPGEGQKGQQQKSQKGQQQPKKGQQAPPPQQRAPDRGPPLAQAGALRPPRRPAEKATLGRPIALSANHFAVTVKAPVIFHYDVDVKPMPPKALYKKVILQWMSTEPRLRDINPVFDSKKNIYTARRIPGVTAQVEIKYKFEESDREQQRNLEFTILLQPTGSFEIDLNALNAYCQRGTSVEPPLRPIQALDIAMKYGAQQKEGKVMLGSCLLSQPLSGRTELLRDGVEVWFGHFQSLRLGWKPFLNVDATQRAFLMSGKVHEIMADMYRARVGQRLQKWDEEDFGKKIATLKVSYPRGAYVATVGCNGVKGAANEEKFDCEGRMVTVQQYFEDKLKRKLQFPGLPCVWVGDRSKRNLVPMELCTIPPGQEYRRKLTDIQTSNMIKVAATPADVRKRKILDAVAGMNFANEKYCQTFGITVDSKMTSLTGRVLPPPKLSYGNQETGNPITPRDGVWNMMNAKFVDAREMNHFGVISIADQRFCNDEQINIFFNALTQAGRNMGMRIGNCLFVRRVMPRELETNMQMAKSKFPQLQILFIIINKKNDPAYETVKRVGDLVIKVTTQCVQHRNVVGKGRGPDPSTMANICLKLNAKLGGINNLIHRDTRPRLLLNEQIVIMGADVTHPGADQQDTGKPSIAAVVASVDPRASQYACEIRIQRSKQEYIEAMEDMVYNLLLKFNRATGATSTGKPQRIIFYRDGVSEGQFAMVLEKELSAIRKACTRLHPDYKPPVTFVVVQKRHHTRLFPENPRDECGKGKNVPPGTVVDTAIVHPTENDFFLVSHLGIQGTSRPTHYHLLWDDSNFTADELQIMTYYLCYMFTRCTRSVSYPAPCYYSHLVAFRGRQYWDALSRNRNISSAELQRHIDMCRDISFMFFV